MTIPTREKELEELHDKYSEQLREQYGNISEGPFVVAFVMETELGWNQRIFGPFPSRELAEAWGSRCLAHGKSIFGKGTVHVCPLIPDEQP